MTIGMFIGIGWGLASVLGNASIWMGVAAGIAVAGIFHLRNELESAQGKSATQQPSLFGFEAEDILYLTPLVTLSDTLPLFLKAAAIGAPVALIIVLFDYRRRTRNP